MAGITSIGAYITVYRLQREEIARMWGTRGIGGEEAGPRQVKNPKLGLARNLGGNAGMGIAGCVVPGNEKS
jgi:hypothetical protein